MNSGSVKPLEPAAGRSVRYSWQFIGNNSGTDRDKKKKFGENAVAGVESSAALYLTLN